LLTQEGRYLVQTIIFGTSHRGFQPSEEFYRLMLRNMGVLNVLMGEEYGGEERFLRVVGTGVLSESGEVCRLCCRLLEEVDSEWVEREGVGTLLKSPHG
jgi:hypothetical protein